jgi:hypothetical protein
VTLRGGIRSLAARLRQLESRVPAPQGPIEYRVLFHDGTPVYPKPGEDPTVPLVPPNGPAGVTKVGNDLIYRITMFDASELDTSPAEIAR